MAGALLDGVLDAGTLAAGLRRRVPAVADALDDDAASARARDWLAAAGERPGRLLDVRTHSVLYRGDGALSLRHTLRIDTGGRVPRRLELLVRVGPDGGTQDVAAFPHDPALPTLPAMVDPAAAIRVLRATLPGVGGERGAARCSVTVVHHPRSGACVLRYDVMPGAGGSAELRHPRVFAKVYPDHGDAERAAAALRAVSAPAGGAAPGVVVPSPLGVCAPLRAGFLEALPGSPLAGGGAVPAVPGVRAAGAALAALHRRGARGPLPPRGWREEVEALEADLGAVRDVWPDVAERVTALVSAACGGAAFRGAAGAPVGADVVSHGDFTPSQVLLAGGVAALVDLDAACRADPALDAGRFLAYLDARAARGAGSRATADPEPGEAFLSAYAAAGGPRGDAFRARVRGYRAVSLGRMALHAARQLKDGRLRTALGLLDDDENLDTGRPRR